MPENTLTHPWRLSVAPMMDWTDRHCRYLHRLLSHHALLYTEMVTTGALMNGDVARHLRFDAAANAIYHFVWDQFCDWYLELIKPVLSAEGDAGEAAETRAVAGWVLDQILVMLHPFMPFITEEL
mgnify:CR=1 FL=1